MTIDLAHLQPFIEAAAVAVQPLLAAAQSDEERAIILGTLHDSIQALIAAGLNIADNDNIPWSEAWRSC